MKISMNLSHFLNDEFLEKSLELNKIHVGNTYYTLWVSRHFAFKDLR